MENSNINPEQKDEKLWKLAKKRAAFKKHIFSYLIVNAFLWIIWLFSNPFWSEDYGNWQFGMHHYGFHIPWPLYVSFFWGIGLAFDYFHSYIGYKETLEEKEYKRLINKKN